MQGKMRRREERGRGNKKKRSKFRMKGAREHGQGRQGEQKYIVQGVG